MNFNYSYRAFLITALLFGIFFLILYSVKLSSEPAIVLEKYDVEYEEALPIAEEEEALAKVEEQKQTTIETNRAYNEAEKILKELEQNAEELSEETIEEKLAQIDAAIANNGISNTSEGIKEAKKKIEEAKAMLAVEKAKASEGASSNKRTTISYRLVDRKAMALPNPVYTCEGGGKIVISIEVDAMGKVKKATYNRGMSTTANGCLIESALAYANSARFTTKAGKDKQLGTITYNFPGQN